ncbi:DgyrCDS4064 [Dimorphilus gyrociliatus]|uniref:DgyrCDS4064 n=1 Tax=Dimorphilus gyrociliatus TaxID=2664684 RepID=A0A7I8VHA6_9ANNE|nr:DgyrCDS4064 [Dimorphilus gyrociliatus]
MSPPISKENKDILQKMIIDTIAMLCRSHFEKEPYFRLDGVVGLTLSSDDVVLINMHKEVENETALISHVRKRPLDEKELNSEDIKRRKTKREQEDDSDWVDLTDHDIEVKEEVDEPNYETLPDNTARLEDDNNRQEDHSQDDRQTDTPPKNNWPGLAGSSTSSAEFCAPVVGKIVATPLSTISTLSTTGVTSAGSTKQVRDKRTCQLCLKRFPSSAHVHRHMVVHTKEKRYACLYCDVRYSQKTHLTSHIAKKHPEISPFSCDCCSMKFKSYKEMKEHRNTNHFLSLA